MLIFYSFPLQTPASFKGHPLTCKRCPFLILIGISKSTRVDLGITIMGYACGIIINSVPGLEINYTVTLKSSSILPTLPLKLYSHPRIFQYFANTASLLSGHLLPHCPAFTHLLPSSLGTLTPSWWCSGLTNHWLSILPPSLMVAILPHPSYHSSVEVGWNLLGAKHCLRSKCQFLNVLFYDPSFPLSLFPSFTLGDPTLDLSHYLDSCPPSLLSGCLVSLGPTCC